MTIYMQHPIFKFSKGNSTELLRKMAYIDVFCQMMQDESYSVAEIQSKRESLYRETFGG